MDPVLKTHILYTDGTGATLTAPEGWAVAHDYGLRITESRSGVVTKYIVPWHRVFSVRWEEE